MKDNVFRLHWLLLYEQKVQRRFSKHLLLDRWQNKHFWVNYPFKWDRNRERQHCACCKLCIVFLVIYVIGLFSSGRTGLFVRPAGSVLWYWLSFYRCISLKYHSNWVQWESSSAQCDSTWEALAKNTSEMRVKLSRVTKQDILLND